MLHLETLERHFHVVFFQVLKRRPTVSSLSLPVATGTISYWIYCPDVRLGKYWLWLMGAVWLGEHMLCISHSSWKNSSSLEEKDNKCETDDSYKR